MERDDSKAGAPALTSGDGAILGVAGAGAPPPTDNLIVELELAPGAVSVGAVLATNLSAFIAGAASSGSEAPPSNLADVLSVYGVQEARSVFTPEQVQADEARTQAVRNAAMVGAATQDQASGLERLPSLASFVRVRFPNGTNPADVLNALKRLPEVARAVVVPRALPPVGAYQAVPPTDPLIGIGPVLTTDSNTGLDSQWYLHRTRTPQAWSHARGRGVVIADVDWGFRTSHQDLENAVERTYNAVDGGIVVNQGPSAAHGTAVVGIAAARADGIGMAGFAPEATLWLIQGDSAPGPKVFEEPWAEAIDYVRRTDAGGQRKVIIVEVQTGAFGNYEQVPVIHRAIRAAIADGCIVCVAAGNGNRPADRSDMGDPFDPTGSILVGATAYDPHTDKRAWFSNYGTRVVVSAPGDSAHDLTCGSVSDKAYRNDFGGTSGATPKVAGAVALMLSVNPTLSHNEICDILAGTGSPLTEDPGKPIGVFLNVEAAVAESLRRRTEAAEQLDPIPWNSETASPKSSRLHGVGRRKRQVVLPPQSAGPITWAALQSEEDASPSLLENTPPAGDKTLKLFRETVAGTLTQRDRIAIVEQAIQMLDNFYVHRPLKEAMHAVRPVQRLRVMLRRLQQFADIPDRERDELAFHNAITQIFNSVRDLHTSYQLPRPYREYIAYLPFEVAPFYEDGRRRYLVTRVLEAYAFADDRFKAGAELIYWNGMAIERAVAANAEQTAGNNDAARHARGVSALTIRPMNTALPPDADFVELEFFPRDAAAGSPLVRMRQDWFARYAPNMAGSAGAPPSHRTSTAAPPAPPSAAPPGVGAVYSLDLGRESTARATAMVFETPSPFPPPGVPPIAGGMIGASSAIVDLGLAATLGLDTAADAVRQARDLIFEAAALRSLDQASVGDEAAGIRGSSSPGSIRDTLGVELNVRVPWNLIFRARTVDIAGVAYGYVHIRTFYVSDADGFVQEFVRLLEQMPTSGLILDVRGNGGGNIWAAERLLQTLTPAEIAPERMQFIATPGTRDLCRNNPSSSLIPLHAWQPSLEEAVETGSVYSQAFPLTTQESCNAVGQKYYGPVVLVIDGNCYSATDIFAAGFQDHGVGKVLGVSTNTGAGGANVWEHWLLRQTLPFGWGLTALPNEAGMRVAIRQSLRVGPRAGALLEDFGVLPDEIHNPTRDDVMEGDSSLLARAAALLAPRSALTIRVTNGPVDASTPPVRTLNVETRGLTRLDFYVDGRPVGSADLNLDGVGGSTVMPRFPVGSRLMIAGFAEAIDASPAARYRGQVQ